MINPYESPTTPPRTSRGSSSSVLLWLCAAVLWTVGLIPGVLVVARAMQPGALDIPPDWWWPLGLAVVLVCVCPMIGFGLLGLACVRRSWRLAAAGAAVLGVAFVLAMILG
jgi:hypothetical protein